jgi:NO-binding membrane sensor protein with MHYT domain
MEIKSIIYTGIYASPIAIGGLFYEKGPFFMSLLIVFGCILIAVKLNSECETAKIKRRFIGYGDLK